MYLEALFFLLYHIDTRRFWKRSKTTGSYLSLILHSVDRRSSCFSQRRFPTGRILGSIAKAQMGVSHTGILTLSTVSFMPPETSSCSDPKYSSKASILFSNDNMTYRKNTKIHYSKTPEVPAPAWIVRVLVTWLDSNFKILRSIITLTEIIVNIPNVTFVNIKIK